MEYIDTDKCINKISSTLPFNPFSWEKKLFTVATRFWWKYLSVYIFNTIHYMLSLGKESDSECYIQYLLYTKKSFMGKGV